MLLAAAPLPAQEGACIVLRPERGEWRLDSCAPPDQQRHSAAGSISARALAHKTPKAARAEFDRGVQAWRKRQSAEAVRHLSEAARLDPGFVEALANLGVVYAGTGELPLALDSFRRALVLEPNQAVLRSRRASVLMMLKRPQEAEQEARRALQLDPDSIESHFTLGLAMFVQGIVTPETSKHLSAAADKYPGARALLSLAAEDFAGLYVH